MNIIIKIKQHTTIATLLLFSIGLFLSCNTFAAPTNTPFATKAEFQAAVTALQNQIDDLAQPAAHRIGEAYGGGIVFYINSAGTHGLVAATQDQSGGTTWYEAQDAISTVANHDTAGQAFTDWRSPTANELNLLYLQRDVVGGFDIGVINVYWSSTEFNSLFAWVQSFDTGIRGNQDKDISYSVRAVRAF